ncbi:MAG: hypothetical protein HFJ09_07360 [Lachnospiraceae bacterium]|nr:hypothetical protein [Lachnospiraceae bacterium]
MRSGIWEQVQKYVRLFSLVGCIVLLVSCGIKEDTATDETDTLEEKDNKESITKNQEDKESQDLQEGNKRVEFTIHNKNSHGIMGVTLPKGWNYSFVGATHEDIRKDNKCCCSDPTEDVRRVCTCLSDRKDKESALICQNAFKGKGVQSESKDLEEYGISFWKEENPKMKIQYLYHKDRLFFCATGVTIGKEILDNGGIPLKAESLMEEIEGDIWYTLILDRTNLITGDKGDYAIHCEVEKKLWNQYQKEIREILEGITLQKCR